MAVGALARGRPVHFIEDRLPVNGPVFQSVNYTGSQLGPHADDPCGESLVVTFGQPYESQFDQLCLGGFDAGALVDARHGPVEEVVERLGDARANRGRPRTD